MLSFFVTSFEGNYLKTIGDVTGVATSTKRHRRLVLSISILNDPEAKTKSLFAHLRPDRKYVLTPHKNKR